ncbi:MAG: hypothetical protein ACRDAL_06725, partial [Plesiomonas shigelloides]
HLFCFCSARVITVLGVGRFPLVFSVSLRAVPFTRSSFFGGVQSAELPLPSVDIGVIRTFSAPFPAMLSPFTPSNCLPALTAPAVP